MAEVTTTTAARSGASATMKVSVRTLTGAGNYTQWKVQIAAALAQCGVRKTDYTEKNEDWSALVTLVDGAALAAEKAARDAAFGRTASSSRTKAEVTAVSPVLVELVARGRKAYNAINNTLSEELRHLARQSVQDEEAFALWSFVLKRFEGTEQDHVADMWVQFTNLRMDTDEKYDEYKARVDEVTKRLTDAKNEPPAGLYAAMLLTASKLQPTYDQSLAALRAAGLLKDPATIKWDEVLANMALCEREQQRREEADNDGEMMQHAMAARRTTMKNSKYDRNDTKCYNCNGSGHYSRECPKPHTEKTKAALAKKEKQDRRRDTSPTPGESENDSSYEEGSPRSTTNKNQAMAVHHHDTVLDDNDDDEEKAWRKVRHKKHAVNGRYYAFANMALTKTISK